MAILDLPTAFIAVDEPATAFIAVDEPATAFIAVALLSIAWVAQALLRSFLKSTSDAIKALISFTLLIPSLNTSFSLLPRFSVKIKKLSA